MNTDRAPTSASDVAKDIASGTVTSEQVCTDLIEEVRAHSDLNAFATFDPAGLLSQARQADDDMRAGKRRGPLHGVPLIIKDNINTADLPTSGGTPALKGNQTTSDAPIVARLRQAGALIAGKANLHELSSGGTSANHTFGPVRNPYAMTHVPGGSSGGTAAAVAAGLVPAGLGTDTAGSVRVPASLCGLFGFRPTVGRYPAAGIVPLSTSLDTAGPLATSMADILLLDSILTDQSSGISGRDIGALRLGVADNLMARTNPDCVAVIERVLSQIEYRSATLVPLDLADLQPLQKRASGNVIDFEFEAVMTDYLTAHAPGIELDDLVDAIASPAVKAFTEDRLHKNYDADAYQDSVTDGLKTLNAAWTKIFDDHALDAVVFPTTPEPALPLDQDDHVLKDGQATFSWFYFQHTSMASIGRRPGVTMPAGLTSGGLPVGLEVDGLPGRDDQLLAVAQAVASVLDPIARPTP